MDELSNASSGLDTRRKYPMSPPNHRAIASSWSALNQRQKSYLSAIYDADQDVELAERAWWSRGGKPRPAVTWRWMLYAILDGRKQPVMDHLHRNCAIDEGTGATFAALERRGLIQTRMVWEYEHLGERLVFAEALLQIQMTSAGRKLVRQARAIGPAQRMVQGTLREWHWRALALAYRKRGEKGVESSGAGYGHIGWNTWLRLRDYKPAPLIQESREGWSSFVTLTPFGEAFYARCWPRYRQLYPEVVASDPEQPVDPFAPYTEVSQTIATCRVCSGSYWQEVTKVFQLQANHTWKTTEYYRRLGEATVDRYEYPLRPCRCEDAAIQERKDTFFAVLDLVAHLGWRIWFPEHHVMFSYLPYLANHHLGKQETYDPTEIKHVFEPLLSEKTDLYFNIAKGTVRFVFNEGLGQGSLYGILEDGKEHFAPAAFVGKKREG